MDVFTNAIKQTFQFGGSLFALIKPMIIELHNTITKPILNKVVGYAAIPVHVGGKKKRSRKKKKRRKKANRTRRRK